MILGAVSPFFVAILLLLFNAFLLASIWKSLTNLNQKASSNKDELLKNITVQLQERLAPIENAVQELRRVCSRLGKDLEAWRQFSEHEIPPEKSLTSVHNRLETEVEKKTAIYNRVRKHDLPETVLPFKRVRVEFLDGSRLEDLAREPLLEEHASGDGVVVRTADDQVLLFPYFHKKRLGEKIGHYFSGESAFHRVIKPAICKKMTDSTYEVTHKGILE